MDPLPDPVGDRFMKDIIPPPHIPISEELLYPNPCKNNESELNFIESNIPNWEALKTHLYKEGRVSKEHCQRILRETLAMISIVRIMINFCY
jgi:serine/threonine-protein phosphatase 2B catalytic subunit